MHTTYILYSQSVKKFYTGSTSQELESRLRRHNSNHKGFTGKAEDWELVYFASFYSISDARRWEKRIKKRGARRFLEEV